MAGETNVKTKTGVMKAMVRAQQNGAFYGDTTQFDTKEFQELILLARKLNDLEQQVLLSAQHILFRGKLHGFSLSRIQEFIPEVENWLSEIDNRERRTTFISTKGAGPAEVTEKPRPSTEESVANAGEFFAGMEPGAALTVQAEEDAQRAGAAADQEPLIYYGEHRFSDGKRVQLEFTSADKRLSSLHGVYTMSVEDEKVVRKAGVINRSLFTFVRDPDIVTNFRRALEREREDYQAEVRANGKGSSLDDFADAQGAGEPPAEPEAELPPTASAKGRKRSKESTKKKPEVNVH